MLRVTAVLLLALPPASMAQQQEIKAKSPDGARVATAKDKTINVADSQTGKLLISIKAHTKDISALSYSPDGKLLASADGDGNVRLFDIATGKALLHLKANPGVNKLEFSADGRKLEAKAPGGARKYDVATGKEEK